MEGQSRGIRSARSTFSQIVKTELYLASNGNAMKASNCALCPPSCQPTRGHVSPMSATPPQLPAFALRQPNRRHAAGKEQLATKQQAMHDGSHTSHVHLHLPACLPFAEGRTIRRDNAEEGGSLTRSSFLQFWLHP